MQRLARFTGVAMLLSIIFGDAGTAAAVSVEQQQALVFLALRISSTIASLFLCFYGTASAIRGYLIILSEFLPKPLGVLLMIGGACFCLGSATYILAPQYGSAWMLMPMALAS